MGASVYFLFQRSLNSQGALPAVALKKELVSEKQSPSLSDWGISGELPGSQTPGCRTDAVHRIPTILLNLFYSIRLYGQSQCFTEQQPGQQHLEIWKNTKDTGRFLKKAPQRLLIARVRVSTRPTAYCVDSCWNHLPVTAGEPAMFIRSRNPACWISGAD